MANKVLTPRVILREVYALMHQTSNFIMRMNRQYDDRFAQTGAKIGQVLDVRLPPKYVTRRGSAMQVQNHVERKVPLPLTIIDGIDLNFSQEELTFDIQDFSERVLRPAVAQLTATVEAEAFNVYKHVPNYVGVVTTTADSGLSFAQFARTGALLTDNLAPRDGNRTAILNTESTVTFSDAVKGLFQDSEAIRQQYVEGIVGRTGGYDVYENTIVPAHTGGVLTSTGDTVLAVTTTAADSGFDGTGNAWPDDDSFDLKVSLGATAQLKEGDILTISGVYDVHPETKQSRGYLKRFVVAEDVTVTTTGVIPIRPVPILSGAYQNVSAPIANNAPIQFHGVADGDDAIAYGQNLMFHRDAFAFVTADLEDPSQYGAWGGREVMDGLSIRIWRQGDITNGTFPCRLDIAYGYAPIYPEWAVRHTHVRAAE